MKQRELTLSSSITVLRNPCGRQFVLFSFPIYQSRGLLGLSRGGPFLPAKLVTWAGSLERGAQPFKTMSFGKDLGASFFLCIWGTDEKTLLVSALCFCWVHISLCSGLPPSLPPSLLPSPGPFLAAQRGWEGRAKFNLTRRSGCLVPSRSPQITAESWPFTEQHKATPVPFTVAVAMADPNNIPQLRRPPQASEPPPTDLQSRQEEVRTAHRWARWAREPAEET